MKCINCSYFETIVKDSRVVDNGSQVKRRRFCNKCKFKFTTIERIELKELFVLKKSGVKKQFDSNKILKSIDMATRKRDIPEKKIKQMFDNVVHKIETIKKNEISSKEIGELIMVELVAVDKISYIRFASVYKEFNTTEDFANLINSMSNL
jgi:transcriptional repressor NrdR